MLYIAIRILLSQYIVVTSYFVSISLNYCLTSQQSIRSLRGQLFPFDLLSMQNRLLIYSWRYFSHLLVNVLARIDSSVWIHSPANNIWIRFNCTLLYTHFLPKPFNWKLLDPSWKLKQCRRMRVYLVWLRQKIVWFWIGSDIPRVTLLWQKPITLMLYFCLTS